MDYPDTERNDNCRKNGRRVPISVQNRKKANRVDQLLLTMAKNNKADTYNNLGFTMFVFFPWALFCLPSYNL